MVLFPDKSLSYIFHIFLCILCCFFFFPFDARISLVSVSFIFLIPKITRAWPGVVMANDSFSDHLFFGNEARYPYDLRSQICLCILPKNAPYDCCYFHTARFSGDIYRTKVDNTTVSYNFTSATGDQTAILRDRLSQANFEPFAGQRQYLHSSVILRPWVLVRTQKSNRWPPPLQWSALPTELILLR